ncbi:MAG: serine/threonine protein kinase, partial [Planctomycetes bacterium]|nr:serine/threonine protein kinase [Planctomycetota bacterium]
MSKSEEKITQGLNASEITPGADDSATVLDENLVKARKLPPAGGVECKPGQILGKCKIEKELGRGGMGAVYLARHTTLDVEVAVKILPPEIANRHHQFADRFMREARLAAKFKHHNTMGLLDADKDPDTGLYYIVLEFVDGGSVRDLMDKGPLSEVKVVDIAMSVAEALDAAAEFNIIHRDIKPDNIMLTSKGAVKLADMGIAKQRGEEDTNITMSSSMMGTP